MRAVLLLAATLSLAAAAPAPSELLARAERAEAAGRAVEAAQDATRVVVDAPASDAAAAAAALMGRVRLREGAFGEAAWWLERALAGQAPASPSLSALRTLAVRSLLRREGMGGGWEPPADVAPTGVRRPGGLVCLPSGERAVLDGRAGALVWIAPDGRPRARTEIGEAQAAALTPGGEVVVAAGAQVLRVSPAQPQTAAPFGSLGSFAPASALAVGGDGAVWVADRRGTRLGRLRAGASEPEVILESKGVRMEAVAPLPPGRGMAVLDTRAGVVFAVDLAGRVTPLPSLPWGERGRPILLSVDAAGQLAVLDGRSGELVLLDAEGVRDRLPSPESARDLPQAVAVGLDGSLELVTGDGRLRRSP